MSDKHHFHRGACKACNGNGVVEHNDPDDPDAEADEFDCDECHGDGELCWPWEPVDPEGEDPDYFACAKCDAKGVELTDYSDDTDCESLRCWSCAMADHERLCGCDDPLWRRPAQGSLPIAGPRGVLP